MTSKKIDLGEYVITIYHDDETGKLDVTVFDELGDIIESIKINTDEDDDDIDDDSNDVFNLN